MSCMRSTFRYERCGRNLVIREKSSNKILFLPLIGGVYFWASSLHSINSKEEVI